MSKISPTQLSLKEMRGLGYDCDIAEYFNFFSKRRKDLFGIIDIVCLGDGETIGLQTTSYSNTPAHRKKALQSRYLRSWLRAGNRYILHGWRKKNGKWLLKSQEFHLHKKG